MTWLRLIVLLLLSNLENLRDVLNFNNSYNIYIKCCKIYSERETCVWFCVRILKTPLVLFTNKRILFALRRWNNTFDPRMHCGASFASRIQHGLARNAWVYASHTPIYIRELKQYPGIHPLDHAFKNVLYISGKIALAAPCVNTQIFLIYNREARERFFLYTICICIRERERTQRRTITVIRFIRRKLRGIPTAEKYSFSLNPPVYFLFFFLLLSLTVRHYPRGRNWASWPLFGRERRCIALLYQSIRDISCTVARVIKPPSII